MIEFDEDDLDILYQGWGGMLREHTGRVLFGPQSNVADAWRHAQDVAFASREPYRLGPQSPRPGSGRGETHSVGQATGSVIYEREGYIVCQSR